MVPTDSLVLPGGCLVVTGRKVNVFVSLEKGAFGPLAPRGGFGGSSPHSRAYLTPLSEEGGLGGSSPHSRAKLVLSEGIRVGWAHLYLIWYYRKSSNPTQLSGHIW